MSDPVDNYDGSYSRDNGDGTISDYNGKDELLGTYTPVGEEARALAERHAIQREIAANRESKKISNATKRNKQGALPHRK